MSVGKAILKVRLDRHMTQREVSERAGLAVSYISRIENNRVQPTMRTLTRLAEALDTQVSGIFATGEGAASPEHKCPVSSSGQCIGELIRSRHGRRPKGARVPYGELELRMLKMTDFLARHGSAEVRQTLVTVLESLMLHAEPRTRGEQTRVPG